MIKRLLLCDGSALHIARLRRDTSLALYDDEEVHRTAACPLKILQSESAYLLAVEDSEVHHQREGAQTALGVHVCPAGHRTVNVGGDLAVAQQVQALPLYMEITRRQRYRQRFLVEGMGSRHR